MQWLPTAHLGRPAAAWATARPKWATALARLGQPTDRTLFGGDYCADVFDREGGTFFRIKPLNGFDSRKCSSKFYCCLFLTVDCLLAEFCNTFPSSATRAAICSATTGSWLGDGVWTNFRTAVSRAATTRRF